MEISQYLSTARIMAFISFIIGTLIFALHCVAPNSGIIIIGLYYVILAGISNLHDVADFNRSSLHKDGRYRRNC